jgi:hypothetical protein
VHLARDTRLGREVAIALIKSEGLDLVRVRREAEAMGRLGDHPNVVTVHDVAEEGERVCHGERAAPELRLRGGALGLDGGQPEDPAGPGTGPAHPGAGARAPGGAPSPRFSADC